MTETPTLLVYTTYRVSADDVEAFRSLALRMATTARTRDGCNFLDVARDSADPATFRLVEGWRDQPALDTHSASSEFQAILQEASQLKITGRAIDVYMVAGKKTVALPR